MWRTGYGKRLAVGRGQERKRGDQEAVWLIQARGDGGSEQWGHHAGGKTQSDSWYTLTVQRTWLWTRRILA